RGRSSVLPHQVDAVGAVNFADADLDPVTWRSRNRHSDHVCGDRQFPAAAVHQHGQQDPAGSAEVGDLVECRAHGPPGVQHVVDDHHAGAIDLGRQPGLVDHRTLAGGLDVVAIEGDAKHSATDL